MNSDLDNEIPKRQCTQYSCICGGIKKINVCMVYDYNKWLESVEKEEKEKEEKKQNILIII